jgi:hypothetical protein
VFSSGAGAGPVLFNITSAQFLPGAGYGVDANESSGTLLDVRFSTSAFTAQAFLFSLPGQSATFNFGTIDLEEPNANGGIVPNETDNLSVTAKLTFTNPTGVQQSVAATGVATVGLVSDSSVDYFVHWSPVTVLFGNGGSFDLSLSDMSFNDMGTQFESATVTLLTLSSEVPPNNVPEPSSIALVGIAIGCAAAASRRRAKA